MINNRFIDRKPLTSLAARSNLNTLVERILQTPIDDIESIKRIVIEADEKEMKGSTILIEAVIKRHFISDNRLYIKNIVYAVVLFDLIVLAANVRNKSIESFVAKFPFNFNDIKLEVKRLGEHLSLTLNRNSQTQQIEMSLAYDGSVFKSFPGNKESQRKKNTGMNVIDLNEKSNKKRKTSIVAKKNVTTQFPQAENNNQPSLAQQPILNNLQTSSQNFNIISTGSSDFNQQNTMYHGQQYLDPSNYKFGCYNNQVLQNPNQTSIYPMYLNQGNISYTPQQYFNSIPTHQFVYPNYQDQKKSQLFPFQNQFSSMPRLNLSLMTTNKDCIIIDDNSQIIQPEIEVPKFVPIVTPSCAVIPPPAVNNCNTQLGTEIPKTQSVLMVNNPHTIFNIPITPVNQEIQPGLFIKTNIIFNLPIAAATDKPKIDKIKKPYDLNNKSDIQRLSKETKIEYKDGYDYLLKTNNISLIVDKVFVIGGEFGVFNNGDTITQTGEIISCYLGERKTGEEAQKLKENKECTNDSLYEVPNENGGIDILDGRKFCNWTRFVNHSPTPNLDKINVINEKGETEVAFLVSQPIKPGDQLTQDYGSSFFDESFKPYFINSSDNSESYEYRYLKFSEKYLPDLYNLDMKTKLKLDFPKDALFLIPSIFEDIGKNDLNSIIDKLKLSYPTEIYAYYATANQILKPEFQQHFTALMYACVLKNIECINLLLNASANVDMRMLRLGYSPVMLLLLDNTLENKDQIEETAIKLFLKMQFPFVPDIKGRNILHYAIECNFNQLIKTLFKRAGNMKILPLDLIPDLAMLIEHIDACIRGKQLETLSIMLNFVISHKKALETNFDTAIEYQKLFKAETVKALSGNQQQELNKLVKSYNIPELSIPENLINENSNSIQFRK